MIDFSERLLGGVRVLDLAEERGLYAGRMLADMGADVVKIEEPGGSRARRIGPFKNDDPRPENSLYYVHFNTNKRAVTLNINHPTGKDLFKRMTGQADIIVEDSQPGTLAAIGLDYPTLAEINPRIIVASITGFGSKGPYSQYKAPDIVSFAMGGLMHISGAPGEPPIVAPCEQAYHSTSSIAAFGIIAALYERLNTGRGQLVEVSAHQVMAAINEELIMRYSVAFEIRERCGSQHIDSPARIYRCKDGFVHVVALRPEHWRKLVGILGNPKDLVSQEWYDPRYRREKADLIDTFICNFTLKHTMAEITERCQSQGVPCSPVNTPEDFSEDPHVKDRFFIEEIEHPAIGRHRCFKPPYGLSKTPCWIYRPAPLLGQHNQDIYCGELGFTNEDLLQLRSEGII